MEKKDWDANMRAAALMYNRDTIDEALEILEKTSFTCFSVPVGMEYLKNGEIEKGIRALNLHDGAYLHVSAESVAIYLLDGKYAEEVRAGLKEQLPDFYQKVLDYKIR